MQRGHLVALAAIAQGIDQRAGGIGGAVGVATDGGIAVEGGLGLIAGLAVHLQAVGALEGAHGFDVIGQVHAVQAGGVVAQLLQTGLQPAHHLAHAARADDDHILLRKGRRGGRGRGNGNRGGHRVNGIHAIKHRAGDGTQDAVLLQRALFLERLDGLGGGGVIHAGDIARIIAQILEALLEKLDLVILVAGAERLGGRLHGRRGRWRHDYGCLHGGRAVEHLLVGGAHFAVGHQAVLTLEELDGGHGVLVAHAGKLALVVAQFLEAGLQLGHGLALGLFADHCARHGRHRAHILAVAAGVLRGVLVELELEVLAGDAILSKAVTLLEHLERLFGLAAELAVHVLLLQVPKLRQGGLEGGHGRAFAAVFQLGILLRARLGRGGGNVGQVDVRVHAIAGLAIVLDLGKTVAGAVIHRNHAAGGNGQDDLSLRLGDLAQLHVVDDRGIVGIFGYGRRRLHAERRVGRGIGGRIGAVDVFLHGIAGLTVKFHAVKAARNTQNGHGIPLLDFFENGGCGIGAAAHIYIIHTYRIIRILRRQRRRNHRQKQRHGAHGGQQARPTVSVPHLHALHRLKWLECVVFQRLL